MTEKLFAITETDLASRKTAARLRLVVENVIAGNGTAVIDFGPVLSVSGSFADELFGVLVIRYGLDRFAEQVRLRGASPSVLRSIAVAVKERLEQGGQTPDFALIAARKALEARRERSSGD